MESRTVRFIDNFSTGTRGAASTEYFLAAGYAVIFLHRERSAKPFVRHFPEEKLLDLFVVAEEEDNNKSASAITVKQDESTRLARVLRAYHSASSTNSLLSIPFFSLQDYLYLLKSISDILGQLRQKSMFLLAAAVSDFYIPCDEMPEHKMQSSEGPPEVRLSSVPKMLPVLIHRWAPEAFIISFKLETDPKLLLLKARRALDTYQHQVVVANILEERRKKVVVITSDSETQLEISEEQMDGGQELEEILVQDLVVKHEAFIQNAAGR